MSLRRLTAHGAVYGLTTATARLLNWALTPLYAHRLSVEDFGRMSELYSWMVFGLIAAGTGMETAYFRFGKGQNGSFWQALKLTGYVGGGLALLLGVGVPWIAPILGYGEAPHLLWLTIAIWTVDAWGSFALAYQRALGKPLRFAAIQLTHVALFLLANLWGVGVQGWGLSFILGANLASSLVRLGWALAWAPPYQAEAETPSARLLLTYGLTLTGIGLLGATNDVLDRVLLARHDLSQTALYSAAYKIAMALALFVQAYRQAGEPLLLGDYARQIAFYRRSWILFHAVGLAGVFLLSLWAKPLISTTWGGLLPKPLFPPVYYPALAIVPILLWANLLMGSLVQASIWYKLTEHPTIGLLLTAVGSAITWAGNLYGIPRFGYEASAWTTLAAYGAMVALSVWMGRRHLPGAFPIGPLLPAVLVALTPLLLPTEPWSWRIGFSLVGLVAIGGWTYRLLKPSTPQATRR